MALVGNFNQQLNPRRGVTSFGFARTGDLHRHFSEWDWRGSEETVNADETCSFVSDIGDEAKFEERLLGLVREFTKQAEEVPQPLKPKNDGVPRNSFIRGKGSYLDPSSPSFNSKAWIKNLLAIRTDDPERYPYCASGIMFKDLGVYGYGSATDYQKDVLNIFLEVGTMFRYLTGTARKKIQILQGFDGLVKSGEMLVVLGRPGSGCSTFLKTIAGEMNGLHVNDESTVHYEGIPAKQMQKQFRGEAIYTAETDVHLPVLSVKDTLTFAAMARTPRNRLPGVSRERYAEHMRDVVMAMLGLSHTMNTRVGNDFMRGVSGGERKRVSIAEATLNGSPIQCWDNSTRGLDSANALEFCRTLRLMSKYTGVTANVAIYQASQNAYDVFDKATVLYEGRQIYFGPANEAKEFFTDMGFLCPARQTTADFLTSLTSPSERVIKPGYEHRVPRTPDEFAKVWKQSEAYARLRREMDEYDQENPVGGPSVDRFVKGRAAMKSRAQRRGSPYTISTLEQIRLCTVRGFQRLKGDSSMMSSLLIGNFIMALVISSVFFNMPPTAQSFFQRSSLLFFAVLYNAMSSALEVCVWSCDGAGRSHEKKKKKKKKNELTATQVLTLYAQRPIVEKQARYAMYHPYAEAVASMICDMPYKVGNSISFNIPLYFIAGLRPEASAYFIFWLFMLMSTMAMSMLFRVVAATSRSLSQALVPAGFLIIAMVIYTGFALPIRSMLGWSRWINYLDPIAYAFESLMVNEFHHRQFDCETEMLPTGAVAYLDDNHRACAAIGSDYGTHFVDGDTYLARNYQYYYSHLWRNLGIIFGFTIFFMAIYLLATEFIKESKSRGEVLIFRRGEKRPEPVRDTGADDSEMSRQSTMAEKTFDDGGSSEVANIEKQTAIFQWQDVCYDIKIKGKPRRLLDHVDGWVKPGTCTALMGASGAGKTTLLDVLATRVTMGVVSGEMLVDGRQRDMSFQRKTGYVQQQDLHLPTSTVREALRFSALLRQPSHVSREEKFEYVEEVIKLLDMESYAGAVVGIPGEGKLLWPGNVEIVCFNAST